MAEAELKPYRDVKPVPMEEMHHVIEPVRETCPKGKANGS